MFFSRKCPPFRSRLSPWMRIFYGGVIIAYFSDFIVTPLLIMVPLITIWFGYFPIIINWCACCCPAAPPCPAALPSSCLLHPSLADWHGPPSPPGMPPLP